MTRPSPSDAAVRRRESTYTTPNDRELVITRTFDAPRALVWSAFTDARHLPHWHTGPDGFTMPVCEIDLRPGGTWRYVWRNAQGREFSATGTYREVEPPSRLVYVTHVDGEENTHTTTFEDADGRTLVINRMRFASAAARDKAIPLAKVGTDLNYARLDTYLTRSLA